MSKEAKLTCSAIQGLDLSAKVVRALSYSLFGIYGEELGSERGSAAVEADLAMLGDREDNLQLRKRLGNDIYWGRFEVIVYNKRYYLELKRKMRLGEVLEWLSQSPYKPAPAGKNPYYRRDEAGVVCLTPMAEQGATFYTRHFRHQGWEDDTAPVYEDSWLNADDSIVVQLRSEQAKLTSTIYSNHWLHPGPLRGRYLVRLLRDAQPEELLELCDQNQLMPCSVVNAESLGRELVPIRDKKQRALALSSFEPLLVLDQHQHGLEWKNHYPVYSIAEERVIGGEPKTAVIPQGQLILLEDIPNYLRGIGDHN